MLNYGILLKHLDIWCLALYINKLKKLAKTKDFSGQYNPKTILNETIDYEELRKQEPTAGINILETTVYDDDNYDW